MIEGLKVIFGFVIAQFIVLLALAFGLGGPIAIIRRLLGKKKDYWPDTEDCLLGIGLGLAVFIIYVGINAPMGGHGP